MSKNPKEITDAVVQEVNARGPARGLSGSGVFYTARKVDPDFRPLNYGFPSLRKFLEAHAPALREIGRSGLDPVYGLKEWPDLQVQVRPSTERPPAQRDMLDAWRVWVSPRSPFLLQVGKDTGEVHVVPIDTESRPDDVVVRPAPVDAHRAAAREFLASLPSDHPARNLLTPILAAPEDTWWITWAATLKRSPELNAVWLTKRRDSLGQELVRQLVAGGLSEPMAEAAMATMRDGQRFARRSRNLQAPPSGERWPEATELVEIVEWVVRRMGEQELRRLALPVGLVFDAFRLKGGR